jgi:hypothetical protein
MAIDLETCNDRAITVRVDVAIANNRWAQAAQPLYYNESTTLLDRARDNLLAAEAKHQECLQLAHSRNWL